jgi:hypothetical protein
MASLHGPLAAWCRRVPNSFQIENSPLAAALYRVRDRGNRSGTSACHLNIAEISMKYPPEATIQTTREI